MNPSNYDQKPHVRVPGRAGDVRVGWPEIGFELRRAAAERRVVVVECYAGVIVEDVLPPVRSALEPALVIDSRTLFQAPEALDRLFERDLTDDPVFGFLTHRTLEDLFDPEKLRAARASVERSSGQVLIIGPGAAIVAEPDLLIYADLPRWEAQLRFRRNEISNLGVENRQLKWSLQYKRAFFFDWRLCDKLKKRLIDRWDYVLDTTLSAFPKLARGAAVREGLRIAATSPFRLVPFFDPAPWGGQWLKDVIGLDRSVENFGWGFDGVPEENSLLLRFGEIDFEIPSINVVFHQPRALLGDAVHARFGTEFPIRFDFLDTIGGGNLSLQVHPLTEYIQEHFGMHYTQDESYYLLEAKPGATVYLGFKEGVDPAQVIHDLRAAQRDGIPFPDGKHIEQWPARKHDHFLIPAGTIHCSGAGGVVLEVSATPYIFTFKLWDWGRLGLDGKPRPIHLDHGAANLQWDRTREWTRRNLVNRIEVIAKGDGYREERTGLHEREFIETRRHWFTAPVPHVSTGGVEVLNLVEGREAVVESPEGRWEPFPVHYAETFIVPAAAGDYRIRPAVSSETMHATLKAFVRTEAPARNASVTGKESA